MGADEVVAAGVAELAGAGGGEFGAFGGIEIPDQAGGGIEERGAVTAAATGAVGGGLVDVAHRVGACEGGEGTPAGEASVAGDFPTAEYAIDRTVRFIQEMLAFAEGQFGDEVPLEDVAAVEIAGRVVEAAVVDVEWSIGRGGRVAGADHGERGIERARIQRLGPSVGKVEGDALGEAAGQLRFQRVVGGEIVGVEHVQAAELRVRNEGEGLSGGELSHRDTVLQTRGEGSGQGADRIQCQVGGIQAAHHLRAGLARVEAGIGLQQIVHQGRIVAGLDGVEGVEEAVGEDLRLIDVVGAEEVIAATADVGDVHDGVAGHFALNVERPLVGARGFEIRIHHGVGSGRERRGLGQAAGLRGRRIECGQVGEASAVLAEIGIDGGERGAGQVGQDGGRYHEIVDAVIGDAVVAANRRFAGAEGIPGEAHRGSEIAQLVFEKLARTPLHGVAG